MNRTAARRLAQLTALASLLLAVTGCGSKHRSAAGAPVTSGVATSSAANASTASTAPASTAPKFTGTARPGSSSQPAHSTGPAASANPSGGDEDGSGSTVEKCQVTTSTAVAAAFAARVAAESVSTSGIGSPLCQFKLNRSHSATFGGVSATAVASYPAAAFAQSRRASTGAQSLTGLGNSAFYQPANSTLKVLAGKTALTLQYIGYPAASQPSSAGVRSSLISLARSYLAQN